MTARALPVRSGRRRRLPSARALREAKPAFDRLYEQFDHVGSAADPVHLVRRHQDAADREVAGFCAAALAFGRVAGVLASTEALLATMGASPAAFVRRFDPARDARSLRTFRHRWTDGDDLTALLAVLQRMLAEAGSIEGFFLRGYRRDADDVGHALDSFAARALALPSPPGAGSARYFFPRPAGGSACKRLNLFLRWMVRRDRIDFGVWRRVPAAALVVPLDTHVVRVGRCLGLTRRRSPGWAMAREITAALRRIDPDDPVKYDFSLCRLGMQDACGFNRPQQDAQCPLRGLCRPAARGGILRRAESGEAPA